MLDRLRPVLAALAVLGVAALCASPAAAAPDPLPPAAADLVSFGISPAGPQSPDDRPFLDVSAPPGAVVYEHVAVLNQDDTVVQLQVYGADVVMADGGGLAVRARDDTSTDAGAWIAVPGAPSVDVAPQTAGGGFGYTVVPFTVSIPANAEPGDHLGALVASLETVGQGGQDAPSIELEQRVAARVYIRVDGPLEPGLEVADVSASWDAAAPFGAGEVTVAYVLRNTGNVRMAVEPEVSVGGAFGLLERRADGTRVDELLPGGEARVTTTVPGVWPLVLETVTVDATAVAPAAGDDPGVGTVSGTGRVWAVPWAALGLLVLVVAVLVLRAVRRRLASRAEPTVEAPVRHEVSV
ncbi:hypothetical protein [uncultured Cellulomonas sp.]|uniref:hypothetical protein n=1 Tax=uncultured Cellulomonas sp. TaxID=189682 RepID=UPI0028E7D763|nr:hypothetical protein [uncultured Cellulomonas sp.]